MSDDQERVPAVARLSYEARKRGGCFTRKQALSEGVTKARLEHLIASGAVTVAHPGRGVYRFGGAPDTWEAQLHAATMVVGSEAVVSHRSAARLWSLLDFDSTRAVDLTRLDRRSRKLPPSITLHLTSWLPETHVVKVGAHDRVTTATRTVRDLARVLDLDPLLHVAVDACRRKLTDPARLARCDAELGQAWGATTMRAMLHQLDADCLSAASPPELDLHLGVVRDGRFPPHVLNHAVTLGSRRRVVFDLAWPELLAAVEVDSERYHGIVYDVSQDRARDRSTREGGWLVERVRTTDLEDLPAVLDRIERFLDEAATTLDARRAA